ncbi:HlyD family efflux transporter periplasmic adaptor subunit [Tolypothrix sp. VBCCA 56010]|uniref:HlyD family efflux transporter periplasmic adaptor subunit n=1 Tax=Tolypothrix sp. VBCCA 56010 TaxID=3137731 RepID=UPI003D7DC2C8
MKYQLLFKPKRQGAIVLLVAAVATGAITTYVMLNFRATTRTATTSSVSQTPVDAVAALGYLEPKGEVIHLSAPAFLEGARVDQLLVKRGDRVKKGQVVAILDSRDRLVAALQQAQQQVRASQARLEQVKAGAKAASILAQDAKFQGTKAELEGQINTQRATIANLEAQLQGEKSAQKATVARSYAELRNAQADCQRYQSLYQNGAVSTQTRDSSCLKQETNRELLLEAQANLNRIVTSRGKQIQEAKANLNRTIATQERQIQSEGATLKAVAEVRPVDVQVAQTDLGNAQAGVKRAEAELALAYVRSPTVGQILKIHTRPGELVSNQGIADLGQTDQMYVRAEVYETDISRVRIGQRATIKTDGVIRELQGTVDEIGLQIGKKDVLGTDPTADADVRVVEVKIRLDAKDTQQVAGLTNLQVDVVITTDLS